jgi:hypothetical protein
VAFSPDPTKMAKSWDSGGLITIPGPGSKQLCHRAFKRYAQVLSVMKAFAGIATLSGFPIRGSESVSLFSFQPEGDTSHFNAKGAAAMAKIIAGEIPQVYSELAELLKKRKSVPRQLN